MNTQTVSVQTALLLAAAGFPQPAPAPGQWWGDDDGMVFVFGETIPQPGKYWEDENGDLQPVGGYAPVVRYPNSGLPWRDDYFDARDFRGLVYLPTVGDILRGLPAYDIGYYTALEGKPAFVIFDDNAERVTSSHHPAEAAALAYLELNEK